MFRQVHLFGVLVIILGFTGNAWPQNFSDVVVFGDSLSDSGNFGSLQPLPPGSSFTTNPDPVWSEIVAEIFGASGENSLVGGPNYAFAGACMNPDTPCDFDAVPTVTEQIEQYFLKSDGRADPNALYVIWGGVNDVADSLGYFLKNDPNNLPMAQRLTPQEATLAAASVNVAQIRRLQGAGARHVVVYNLPDISKSPYAVNLGQVAQGALTQLGTAYNERLYAGIRESEEGIVPINMFAFFNEIVENHETYGFTDATGTACGEPDAGRAISLGCGPEGSGSPVTYESGANRQYLFADRNHPSGATHEMIASVVTSTLAAPVQVSLAGEGGVEMAGIHRSAVSASGCGSRARPFGRELARLRDRPHR